MVHGRIALWQMVQTGTNRAPLILMEIKSQFEIVAWVTVSYLFARAVARIFRRWPKAIGAVLSLVSCGATVTAYGLKQEQFDSAILVVCGLAAGTIECWVRIWRESTKMKWIRG
jgi:hypothetical protein